MPKNKTNLIIGRGGSKKTEIMASTGATISITNVIIKGKIKVEITGLPVERETAKKVIKELTEPNSL